MLSLKSMLLLLPPCWLLCSVLKLCLFHEEAQPRSVRSAWRSRQGQLQLRAQAGNKAHPAICINHVRTHAVCEQTAEYVAQP